MSIARKMMQAASGSGSGAPPLDNWDEVVPGFGNAYGPVSVASDGNGTLVVLLNNYNIYYSTDGGITYTNALAVTSMRAVYWCEDVFIAVGTGGSLYTSADGISWTARTSGITDTIYSATKSGSNYLVCANYKILKSTDLSTWSTAYTNANYFLYAIDSNSNNEVVCVGYGSNYGRILYSSNNGTSWSAGSQGLFGQYFVSVRPYGNRFLIGGTGTVGVWSTTAGSGTASKIAAISTTNYEFRDVLVDGTKAVAYTIDAQYAYVSTDDGANWSLTATNSNLTPTDQGVGGIMIFDGSYYYSLLRTKCLQKSTDGLNWQIVASIGAMNQSTSDAISKIGNTIYIRPDQTFLLATSDNGVTFQALQPRNGNVTNNNGRVVEFNGDLYLGGSTGVNNVWKSTDGGKSWQSISFGGLFTSPGGTKLATNGSLLVAAVNNGGIATSSDGTTWTKRLDWQVSYSEFSISTDGTNFLFSARTSTGPASRVYSSSNGTSWTLRLQDNTTSAYYSTSGYANGNFFLYKRSSGIQYSSDPASWSSNYFVLNATYYQLISVAGDGSRYLISDGIEGFVSEDLVTFTPLSGGDYISTYRPYAMYLDEDVSVMVAGASTFPQTVFVSK